MGLGDLYIVGRKGGKDVTFEGFKKKTAYPCVKLNTFGIITLRNDFNEIVILIERFHILGKMKKRTLLLEN